MTNFEDILTGAHGVWSVSHGTQAVDIAVWHGGHTVNSYLVQPSTDGFVVTPTDTASVGDFATGEVSRDQAEVAAESLLQYPESSP